MHPEEIHINMRNTQILQQHSLITTYIYKKVIDDSGKITATKSTSVLYYLMTNKNTVVKVIFNFGKSNWHINKMTHSWLSYSVKGLERRSQESDKQKKTRSSCHLKSPCREGNEKPLTRTVPSAPRAGHGSHLTGKRRTYCPLFVIQTDSLAADMRRSRKVSS